MNINIHARRLVSMSAVSAIMLLLGSGCSAQTNGKLACSSPSVVSTAEALLLQSFRSNSNEGIEMMFDTAHTTMSLEAIRTVESGPRRGVCQASLRVKLAYAANPLGKAIEAEMKKKENSELQEEEYEVQLTDDGEVYVKIIDLKQHSQALGSQPSSNQADDE